MTRDGWAGTDSWMRHWCVGQFRRVAAHLHRTVNSGYSLWRALGDFSCCSSVCLLPETFAVDETSKQITPSLSLITFHYIQSLAVYSRVSFIQGYNARRLLEPDDGELDNNQSDCVSNSRKEAPNVPTNDKVLFSLTFKMQIVWDLYRWVSLLHEIYTRVLVSNTTLYLLINFPLTC